MFFKKDKKTIMKTEPDFILDESLPFGVQEAYKALRTNVIFSLPGDGCKKIVVTSSMQGEAKSTTSVNLAIALAQNNMRVLLIDCDLRLPTIGVKLKLSKGKGLTNLLVGGASMKEAIFKLKNGLYVITAGEIPPNPTELLGSAQMEQLLTKMEAHFDYIILDTPPINTVADAAILSKFCSGVLMVSRHDVATHESVEAALQKLAMADAKVLGFVYTGVKNDKFNGYSKKGSYGYGDSYAKAKK